MHIYSDIQRISRIFTKQSIPTIQFSCKPLQLTTQFFEAYSHVLTNEQVYKYIELLKQHAYIDINGYLLEDPRQSEWRNVRIVIKFCMFE